AAEFVATFLHRDERGNAARPRRLAARRFQDVELVLDRKLGVDDGLAARDTREQFGQAVVALRPDHEVDRRRAADDLLAFRLRDAACDRDHQLAAVARRLLFHHAEAPELGIDLLGGLL